MKNGDEIRLRGPAGALFMVTVGPAFTEADIRARLKTGEWSYPDDKPQATPEPEAEAGAETPREPEAPAVDPDRPGVNAPKSEWVAHVARTKHMSIEDASNYTKADLIEMAS
ncbi:hypothetical protein [Streptomyces sp. NPDC000880]